MQILTWILGKESYGMKLEDCRDVKENTALFHIPGMPDYVAGLANVNGEPVTVLDVSCLFGLDRKENRPSTVALVRIKGAQQNVALLVDRLTDIVTVSQDQIEIAPASMSETQAALVACMVRRPEIVTIVLNPRELSKAHGNF
ncbi:MAG: chemotaxis protein CheW [Leptospirales bacterium]|nr:chemotaxis protein CheW [Leptospirales bacterium]